MRWDELHDMRVFPSQNANNLRVVEDRMSPVPYQTIKKKIKLRPGGK